METIYKLIHGESLTAIERGVNEYIAKLEYENGDKDGVGVCVRMNYNEDGPKYAEVTVTLT